MGDRLGRIEVPPRVAERVAGAVPVEKVDPWGPETRREAAEETRRLLVESRVASWRPLPGYDEATMASLRPTQDPGRRVSTWLDSPARNLVLLSEKNGNGKTWASQAVGHAAAHKGLLAVTWTMPGLNEAMRPDGDREAFDRACRCDVLIVDDLGREKVSEWTLERFKELLDRRVKSRTVFTANLRAPALTDRYETGIVDRVGDRAWIVEFTGPSMRAPLSW